LSRKSEPSSSTVESIAAATGASAGSIGSSKARSCFATAFVASASRAASPTFTDLAIRCNSSMRKLAPKAARSAASRTSSIPANDGSALSS